MTFRIACSGCRERGRCLHHPGDRDRLWSYNNQTVQKDTLLVNNVGTHSITGTVTLSDGTVIENTLEVVIDPSPSQETKHPFYYLKDHLGSTRAVIDAAGNVTESSDYYPFGLQMPGRGFLQGSIATNSLSRLPGKALPAIACPGCREAGWRDRMALPWRTFS